MTPERPEPADVLNRAADLYEHGGVELLQGGWGYAMPGHAACITEALATGARDVDWKFEYPGPGGCACGQCVAHEVARIAGFPDEGAAFDFNDAPGQTKESVIAFLRDRAALATKVGEEGEG